ncbi:hypothetical protein CDO25_22970 (plasmid) [Sinorhizobium meliloti]|nr:hypothetical protein CDO25_22970 [Sinorhizobium meliloti]
MPSRLVDLGLRIDSQETDSLLPREPVSRQSLKALNAKPTRRSGAFPELRFIVGLPFVSAFGIVRAVVYSAWYLAFISFACFAQSQVS